MIIIMAILLLKFWSGHPINHYTDQPLPDMGVEVGYNREAIARENHLFMVPPNTFWVFVCSIEDNNHATTDLESPESIGPYMLRASILYN